jgi:SAM-dependent methyltransferase
LREFLERNKELIEKIAEKYQTNSSINKDDHIFRFIIDHPTFSSEQQAIEYYFSDGKNSARILLDLIAELFPFNQETIQFLEFASGYGCVTRHLLNQQTNLNITSCDIHEAAIHFLEEKLGGKGLISDPVPERLRVKPDSYHIIFCLSFFSHMPDITWFRWLRSLYNALIPGGLLIFTTHGYQSMKQFGSSQTKFDDKGYSFTPVSEQLDLEVQNYGQTFVSPAYVCQRIKLLPGNPILLRGAEGFWWSHQDLWVVQKGNA